MGRFLQDSDYETLIKDEIRKLLDGRAPDGTGTPVKLLKAEQMAQGQMRTWLKGRYDIDTEFAKAKTPTDLRRAFLVMYCIDLTLYHLYSQTGQKDIPKHREDRYTDALDWLKQTGLGNVPGDLDEYPDDTTETPGVDMRISSDEQENYRY